MKKRTSSPISKIWKKMTIVIVIAVLTGSGIGYYLEKQSKRVFQPERFLPENVLFCSNQKNIGPVIDDFASTSLGETLFTTQYARLALDLDAPLDIVEKIREFQSFLLSDTGRMVFDEFMRDEFTVALLPDYSARTLEALVQHNLIIFAKSRHNLSLLKMMLDHLAGEIEHSSIQYGRYFIHRIVFNGFSVSFTAIGENVILCFEERTLREALDRYDAKSVNLLENFFYQELAASRVGAYLFSYFSLEQIHKQLSALLARRGVPEQRIRNRLQRLKGFNSGALIRWRGGSFDRDTVTLFFNRNELDSKTAAFFSIPPEVNRSIVMVPPSSSLYYWTNTFDLQAMWQVYTSESGLKKETLSAIKKRVEMMCGMGFNEVLDLVDNTVHIVLSKPSSVDFVPFPNFTLVLRLTDERRAGAMLNRLLENSRIPHVKDRYRGIGFTFWGAQMQRGLQPVYSIHDQTLYISSSVKMHMNVVDTIMSEQNNLTRNDNYLTSAGFFREPNNSTVFIQFPQFIGSTEDLIKWAGEMLAIQNRATAYRARKVISGFVLPVLEGMHIYESAATRSYVTGNKLIIDTRIIKNTSKH